MKNVAASKRALLENIARAQGRSMDEDHIRASFPGEVVETMVAHYGQRRGTVDGSYWRTCE